MRRFLAGSLCWLVAAATMVACATGVTDTDGDDGFGGGGIGGGSGGTVDTTSSSSSSSGAGAMGGQGGTGGGFGGGGVGGMGEGGSGLVCDFTQLHACSNASVMQPVSGDEGGQPASVTGDTSDWFEVEVEETSGSVFEKDLSFTVTLTMPSGMDYDLVVHEGPEDSGPNCNATPMFGVESGNSETVSHGWDDSQPLGGEDDSRWLSIEVLHVSGTDCGPGFQWTLTVQGDT
jgi:hypothetical protein